MHGSPNASWWERRDMSAVLDKEAWRYSARAWDALHAQGFVAATPSMDLPDELQARRAALFPNGASPVVFVNGLVAERTSTEFHLRDGERLHLFFANVAGIGP